MLTLNKILLPVDFSDRCRAAARYAGALTAHFQSQLTMLHVPDGLAATVGSFSVSPERFGYQAPTPAYQFEGELAAFAESALPGRGTTREVRMGDPADVISRFAAAASTDLIVIPTHGRSPVPRFVLGSVTAKVLGAAQCPVCTGAQWSEERPSETFPPQVVLCALDLGPASEGTLSWATQMASDCHAGLVIVHAAATEGGEPARKIGLLLRSSALSGDPPRIWVEAGEPVRVVAEAAERFKAGLVVIGRGAEEGERLRPNAYAIIRHSPCPVFSI